MWMWANYLVLIQNYDRVTFDKVPTMVAKILQNYNISIARLLTYKHKFPEPFSDLFKPFTFPWPTFNSVTSGPPFQWL